MARLMQLHLGVLAALGILGLRLVDLQLVHGARYRMLAEQNRLRLVPEQAPRGLIVDRHGQALASNQTAFRVAIVPQDLEDFPRLLARVGQIGHRPPEALKREFAKERSLPFVPATIIASVPREVALQLEETRWQLPGLLVKPETSRHYPLGPVAAHLLGYLSQPTADELPLLKQYGVQPKYLVGRMGLEQLLDHALRGHAGGTMVEVDHRGRQVRLLGKRPPQTGARVVLTLDAQLQSLIEQAFGDQPGGSVVLDPETGAVLAMVSVPNYTPESFVVGDTAALKRFMDDRDSQRPMFNRATAGVYPPGSIAKLAIAAAALEHHAITPQTVIHCPGSLTIGDRTFHCWNRDGHGPMTLRDALMQSCNVYFMTVGRKLGAAGVRAAMEQVGFSRRTGWPLEEAAGQLPRRRLTEGEVALLAIGQGEIAVTVLQAAVMAAAWANGQWLVTPWVVDTIGGRAVARGSPRPLGYSPSTVEALRLGMRAVISDPGGTGRRAFTEAVAIAGKTGTAQTQVPGKTHAWFVGFCPVEHPRAAFAIVAEYGGSGGDLPAEIGRAICEFLALPQTE